MTQAQLERRVRVLTLAVTGLALLAGGLVVTALRPDSTDAVAGELPGRAVDDTLTTRVLVADEIVVTDGDVARVRVGGRLPDAIVDGERVPRGGTAAGVLIYDSTGQERGGYVTFDSGNAVLTLDSRRGQQAFFVADTSGSTALRIWRGDDFAELRVDRDGPRFTAGRDGSVAFQRPAPPEPASSATCETLRSLSEEIEPERLRAACHGRMTEAWCARCLHGP